MRYSRELPRERRPLHNILLDVGNVHRGEHTQSSVVRRASCVVRRGICWRDSTAALLQTPLSLMTRAANSTPHTLYHAVQSRRSMFQH